MQLFDVSLNLVCCLSPDVVREVSRFVSVIDVMGLYRMLLKVARHAYNAYPAV